MALTNEPNIKGSKPIANRKPDEGGRAGKKPAGRGEVLGGPGSKRFMWILGKVEKGPHCDDCLSRNGHVKTLLEWLRMGAPKCRCRCALAEVGVDVPEGYKPPVPEPTANRWTDAARAARKRFPGWSDDARAAAAAARAAKRKSLEEKAAGGTASPYDRLQALLDKPFADAERSMPRGREGSAALTVDTRPVSVSEDEIYAAGETDLRDIVGAGPRSGNGFVDAVTAGIGTATLLGGSFVGGKRGNNTLSSIQKSIVRKQARVDAAARSRARKYDQSTPPSEWGGVREAAPFASPSSKATRVFHYMKEGVNASRALITSYDLSAALRQGGILSLSNPGKVPGAMASMFKALFSQKTAEQVDAELRARPNAALYRQGGLYLSEGPTGTLSLREEVFCSELAKKIPGVQASERAFSAYLNRIRADCFDTMVESLCHGHTPTTAELQAVSNYINVATGRGSLGSFEKHASALSTVFFAPKLAVSRFEFLSGQPLTAGTRMTRKAIAEQYGRYLIGLGVVYGLAQMAGADVGTDMTSSDAGKIRVGENTRIDVLSGLGQALTFVSRLAGGVYSTTTGKEYDLGDPESKVTRADVEWRFVRTKLAPLFSANVNLVTGKDIVGDRVTPSDAAMDLVVPLVFRDVFELFQEHQIPTATALSLLSVFGAGVAAYKSNRSKNAQADPDMPPVPTALDKLVSKDARLQAAYLEEERREAEARKAERTVKKAGDKHRSTKRTKEDAMIDVSLLKKTRRDGKKNKARGAGGTVLVTNRWTDAARAARKTFHGWSDAARAAAAEARAKKRLAAGGTYADGRAVIPDVAGAFDGNSTDPSKTYLSSGDELAARQARYAEAFRQWWDGVERTGENIAAFHAFVGSFGGAAAGGAGAYRQATGMSPSAGASQAFGRAGRYVTGKEPVYDEGGGLIGFARVGRRPYARPDNAPLREPLRRAGRVSADAGRAMVTDPATGRTVGAVRYDSPSSVPEGFFRGMRGMGPDPFNSPSTPADFAFQASYGRWLDQLNEGRDAAQTALGRDPYGYPLDTRGSTGDPEAVRVLALYGRVLSLSPRTAEEVDAYGDVLEGLRAYGEMYEADRAERDPGLVDRIAETLDALERGAYGSVREGSAAYAEERLPVEDSDALSEFAHPGAAAEAARALGVLHGSYGAGPEAADKIPASLLEDYVRGLEEGRSGYEYGVVTPADRSGVYRRARAFAEGLLGDINDEYEADHIDDKYNAKKYADPEAWATRNNPDGVVYDPSTPDTRGQYSPRGLMDAALSWFTDAMVAGDKRSANAALSYMSDLMLGFAGDKAGVYRETLGDDEDEAEIDARVPLYDGDGNEIDEDSPFYEDSYADPNAPMPWDFELPFERRGLRNRLFAVYPPLTALPVVANARWSEAYRARVAARRKAVTARVSSKAAARAARAAEKALAREIRAEQTAARKEYAAVYARERGGYLEAVVQVKRDPYYLEDPIRMKTQLAHLTAGYRDILSMYKGVLASRLESAERRALERRPELASTASEAAEAARVAEKARIDSQYDYDKLVAEQDGLPVPEKPVYPEGLVSPGSETPAPAGDGVAASASVETPAGPGVDLTGAPQPVPVSAPAPAAAAPQPVASSSASSGSSTEHKLGGSGEPVIYEDEPETVRPPMAPAAAAEPVTVDEEDEEEKKKVAANRGPRGCRDRDGVPQEENRGWTDAARAASLAVRRAKAEARRKAAEGEAGVDVNTAPGRELLAAGFEAKLDPEQKPLGYLPLSRYDELIEQAEEDGDRERARRLRHKRNEARKAADKSEIASQRSAFEGKRSRVFDDMKVSRGLSADAGGVYERAAAESGAARAGTGLSELSGYDSVYGAASEVFKDAAKRRRLPPALAASYLGGTPVGGAVYYDGDGVLYDADGKVVGNAPRAPRAGAVFYRGRWFDAKTGKAIPSGAVS